MALPNGSQGSALAMFLSALTLATHGFSLLALEFRIIPTTSHDFCYRLYDLAGLAISLIGLVGAVNRRPTMVSAYAVVHALALAVMTLIMLNNLLPSELASLIPPQPYWPIDANFEKRFCVEIDDGFGWDTQWFDRCRRSFEIVRLGLLWTGVAMVAAQWWAVLCVWQWAREFRGSGRRYEESDVERGVVTAESQELKIS